MHPYNSAALAAATFILAIMCSCGSSGGSGTNFPGGGNPNDPAAPGGAGQPGGLIFSVKMQPEDPIDMDLKGVSWSSPASVLNNLSTGKEAACADSGWFLYGSDFKDELTPFNLTRSEEEGEENLGTFVPDWQSGDPVSDLAVGMYLINLKHFDGEQTVGMIWQEDSAPEDFSNLYIGFGDVLGDHWDWYAGPADNVLTLNSFGPYKDASGVMLIAVALIGSDTAVLDRLEIGAEEVRAIGDDGIGSGEADEIPLLGAGAALPSAFDLSADCAPVNDQATWGSCTAFAVGDGAYNYELGLMYGTYGWDLSKPSNRVSPKHMYVVSGELQGFPPGGDYGRYVDQLLGGLMSNGVATEINAPYDMQYNNDWSAEALADAALLEIDSWSEVPCNTPAGIETVKTVLARQRKPLPMRMNLDNSFFYYGPGEVYVYGGFNVGGHAMCVVGYDDARQAFKVRNSWGSYWGEFGHVWISYSTFMDPYAYVACYTLQDNFNPAVAERFCDVENAFFPVNGLSASDGSSENGITVSWQEHEQAVAYRIYRDDREQLVQTVPIPATSWIDPEGADGFGHTYWIQAVSLSGSFSPLSQPEIGYAASAPQVQGVSPGTGVEGNEVRFSAEGIGSGNLSYSWTFGSAATPSNSSDANPEVTLGPAGTYDCLLSVQNSFGTDVFPFELVISGVSPRIEPLLLRNSGYSGEQLQIEADVTGSGLSYSWNFGGGATPNTSSAASPLVTLGAAGRYECSLQLSNAAGSDTLLFELISIPAGNTPWSQGGFDSANSNASPISGPDTNALKWRYFIGNNEFGQPLRINTSICFDPEGKLYFITSEGYFYKLNPDGSFVWRFSAYNGCYGTPVIDSSGIIYIAAGNSIFALNPNGSVKWEAANGGIHGLPLKLSKQGVLYSLSGDKRLHAINTADGSPHFEPYTYTNKNNYGISMVLTDYGLVICSSREGVFAVDAEAAAPVWMNWFTTAPRGPLALSRDQRTVYTFTEGSFVYGLEADCGGEVFRHNDIGAGQLGRPGFAVMPDGRLLAGSNYGKLFLMDQHSGELGWDYTLPLGDRTAVTPLLDREGRIYWTSDDETELYCINTEGSLVWTMDKQVRGVDNLSIGPDGVLYFGANNGCVYAVGPGGSGETFSNPEIESVTPLGGDEGDDATFTAVVNGSGPFTYSWNFGGGAVPNSSSLPSPTVNLNLAGAYDCELTVSSPYGETSYEFQLSVEAAPLEWTKYVVSPGNSNYQGLVLKQMGSEVWLTYSDNLLKEAVLARSTGVPDSVDDWTKSTLASGTQAPWMDDLIMLNGQPVAAGEIQNDKLKIGISSTASPDSADDWTFHEVTSMPNSGIQTKLGVKAGKLAILHQVYNSSQRRETIYLTYANEAVPDGPEDYSSHDVTFGEDMFNSDLLELDGTPAVIRSQRLPGPWNIQLLTTDEEFPDSADDWSGHELAPVPDQSGLGEGSSAMVLGGVPVASYLESNSFGHHYLNYSYASQGKPGSSSDWTRCVVEPDKVLEENTSLINIDSRPAVIYATLTGSMLRIAVAQTPTPTTHNDWRRSMVDETPNTGQIKRIINFEGRIIIAYLNLADFSVNIAVLDE